MKQTILCAPLREGLRKERKEVQGSKRGERTKETTDRCERGVRDGKVAREEG